MNIGITGLTASGKSTLFAAFTRKAGSAAATKGTLGMVGVPDRRLDELSRLFHPRKTVPALVNFEDCPALDTTVRQDRIRLLERLRVMDAFIFVVGAFRLAGAPEVVQDALKTRFELLITDLDFVTKRIERLESEIPRAAVKERPEKEAEMALLRRMAAHLEGEKLLSGLELNPQEQRFITNYGMLTTRPACYVLNVAEADGGGVAASGLEEKLRELGDFSPVLVLQGSLEAEIASLDPAEAVEYLKDFGIERPGRERVIEAAYKLLDLITFFTVGEDECRAWNLPRGGNALAAAGAIHSDLARGFIRAEVIEWDTLLALGSLAEGRKAGKLRLEGKTYLVKEGEIVHIMFNV